MNNNIDFTRINNDVNGNPRYVCHFLEFKHYQKDSEPYTRLEYSDGLNIAKELGGRKFHNKQYGGGVVFQSYNIESLELDILKLTGHAFEYLCNGIGRPKTVLRSKCTNRQGNLKKWLKIDGISYSLNKS